MPKENLPIKREPNEKLHLQAMTEKSFELMEWLLNARPSTIQKNKDGYKIKLAIAFFYASRKLPQRTRLEIEDNRILTPQDLFKAGVSVASLKRLAGYEDEKLEEETIVVESEKASE